MEQTFIEATKYTPRVELNSEGKMVIQGRSIIEDPLLFYTPVIDWVKNCLSKKFTLEIRLEYVNTSSSKLILILLKTIKEYYPIADVYIKWYYESDDEEMLEMGKNYEALIHIPIDFYECVGNVA
jgi:hypothetical protein